MLEVGIFNPAFFELVAMTLCEPSSIGFDMADLEVMTHLPQVCVPLLKALATSPYKQRLEASLRKRISAQRLGVNTHTLYVNINLLCSALLEKTALLDCIVFVAYDGECVHGIITIFKMICICKGSMMAVKKGVLMCICKGSMMPVKQGVLMCICKGSMMAVKEGVLSLL